MPQAGGMNIHINLTSGASKGCGFWETYTLAGAVSLLGTVQGGDDYPEGSGLHQARQIVMPSLTRSKPSTAKLWAWVHAFVPKREARIWPIKSLNVVL